MTSKQADAYRSFINQNRVEEKPKEKKNRTSQRPRNYLHTENIFHLTPPTRRNRNVFATISAFLVRPFFLPSFPRSTIYLLLSIPITITFNTFDMCFVYKSFGVGFFFSRILGSLE